MRRKNKDIHTPTNAYARWSCYGVGAGVLMKFIVYRMKSGPAKIILPANMPSMLAVISYLTNILHRRIRMNDVRRGVDMS
jgi:hypothetical protein